METEEIILSEKDLSLVITEKQLGKLTTNAQQIKEKVRNAISYYNVTVYNEDNIDTAKKDKAMLNNAAKALNQSRIEIERSFMQPFAEFKTTIDDTCTLIKDCSNRIDVVVKNTEQKAKYEKRKKIEEYYDSLEKKPVKLERIFEPTWLNKTTSITYIRTQINEHIGEINANLETLKTYGIDEDVLKVLYLDTLNFPNTVQYANKLRTEREKAKHEAELKAKLAEEARIEAERKLAEQLKAAEATQEKLIQGAQQVQEGFVKIPTPPEKKPVTTAVGTEQIYERTFFVQCTKQQLIDLGNFMNANGINFRKIVQ